MPHETFPQDVARPFVHGVGNVDVIEWNPVRADASSPYPRSVNNFGDLLGPQLVSRIVGRDRVAQPVTGNHRARLLASGSVMHLAPEGAVVWGAGVNFKLDRLVGKHTASLDVRAVRGPVTARALQRAGLTVPAVYGDPVLLLPRFFPELATWGRVVGDEVLVVPNLNDYEEFAVVARALGVRVLSPTEPVEQVLRSIAQARLVVGSSLHAVVVADALGVPARLVASPREHHLKYRDYLAGSGRPLTRIASDLPAAIEMGGHEPTTADVDMLLDVFPWDLWDAARVGKAGDPAAAELESWDAAIEAASTGDQNFGQRLMDEQLELLVSRARAVIEADVPGVTVGGAAADSFSAAWDAARLIRRSSGSDSGEDMREEPAQSVLTALDADHPELAIRAVWLHHVGPHALGRVYRETEAGFVMALSIRPGTLRNNIKKLTIVFRSPDTEPIMIEPPVFDMYRLQWSVDLAFAATDPRFREDHSWVASVELVSGDGQVESLPLLGGESADVALLNIRDVNGLGLWRRGLMVDEEPGERS